MREEDGHTVIEQCSLRPRLKARLVGQIGVVRVYNGPIHESFKLRERERGGERGEREKERGRGEREARERERATKLCDPFIA